MRCASPSTTAVLPTPGSPTSTGLFFVRRDRICITRSISVRRPTTGSSLPSEASFVRLRPNWSSSFEDFLPSGPPAPCWRRLPGPDSIRITSLRIFSESASKSSRMRAATPSFSRTSPEQDVFRADVVVAERKRLAKGELEHLLRARRERDLAGGDLLTGADDAHDLRAHALDGDVQRLENPCGQALFLAEQPEQDVLRPDVVVLELPRLFLSKDDDLAGSLCESLEHVSYLFKPLSSSTCEVRPARVQCDQPEVPCLLFRQIRPR